MTDRSYLDFFHMRPTDVESLTNQNTGSMTELCISTRPQGAVDVVSGVERADMRGNRYVDGSSVDPQL